MAKEQDVICIDPTREAALVAVVEDFLDHIEDDYILVELIHIELAVAYLGSGGRAFFFFN